jgi:hypothetical protein
VTAAPPRPDIEEPKDLGLGSVIGGANEKRLLNRDGTFNPRRRGLPFLTSLAPYHFLLTISWPKFLAIISVGYVAANTLFALAYIACGASALEGIPSSQTGGAFGRAFFFSVETLSTIGYGNIVPNGVAPHVVMTIEALIGLLVFALGSGLLVRDSRGRPPRSCSARAASSRRTEASRPSCSGSPTAGATRSSRWRRRCCSAGSRARSESTMSSSSSVHA